jgi:hypothetical protein
MKKHKAEQLPLQGIELSISEEIRQIQTCWKEFGGLLTQSMAARLLGVSKPAIAYHERAGNIRTAEHLDIKWYAMEDVEKLAMADPEGWKKRRAAAKNVSRGMLGQPVAA